MKLIENILYLEFNEMVECGVPANYLSKAKSTGTKCWEFINDPRDKRKVLIGYEGLRDVYKKMVKERFGDPYEMVARQPILDMIKQDFEANEHYKKHRYDGGKYLPIETVNKYTRAASMLNMLGSVQDDRSIIKSVLGLPSVPSFYLHIAEIIKSEIKNGESKSYTGMFCLPKRFPTTYQRIMDKVAAYRAEGYDHLISDMLGNKAAAKIGKGAEGYDEQLAEKQMAVFRKVAGKNNNMDAEQVAFFVNKVYAANGWPTLSRERVYQIMQELKPVLTPGRRGKREYDNSISMQNKRRKPEFPTYYFTLDGWTAELGFQYQRKTKTGFETCYDGRLVIVVVLDAMNKYPVGYAIGDRETPELIREANRNALMHLKELFGDNYQPYQLQSDRYALKNLTPFYQAMAHLHTPAAVGNAKSKVVEPYFKALNKNYCQKLFALNWTGHNLDAKKDNQVNREAYNQNKKNIPTREGVVQQLNMIMQMERSKKQVQYITQWAAMPEADKKVMSDMDWLMVFGTPIGKRTNSITGQGIIKMIDNVRLTYDSFDPGFRKHFHLDWQIIADLDDTRKVLAVSPDGKLRFVLDRKHEGAMSIKETTQEDTNNRLAIKGFNDDRKKEIMEMYKRDSELVEEVLGHTPLNPGDVEEMALKLILTDNKGQQKDKIQDAKGLRERQRKEQRLLEREEVKQNESWKAMRMEYLKKDIDFDQIED